MKCDMCKYSERTVKTRANGLKMCDYCQGEHGLKREKRVIMECINGYTVKRYV